MKIIYINNHIPDPGSPTTNITFVFSVAIIINFIYLEKYTLELNKNKSNSMTKEKNTCDIMFMCIQPKQ